MWYFWARLRESVPSEIRRREYGSLSSRGGGKKQMTKCTFIEHPVGPDLPSILSVHLAPQSNLVTWGRASLFMGGGTETLDLSTVLKFVQEVT